MTAINKKILELALTEAEWVAGVTGITTPDPVIPANMQVFSSDSVPSYRYKMGDGITAWSALPYVGGGGQSNAIPLAGTETGAPVTGIIYTDGLGEDGEGTFIQSPGNLWMGSAMDGTLGNDSTHYGTIFSAVGATSGTVSILSKSPAGFASITAISGASAAASYVELNAPAASPGINGARDFSANYTANSFVQKVYVDLRTSSAFTTLTIGATTTIVTGGKMRNNNKLTLTQNTTLAFTSLANGAEGSLVVTQDGVGSRTLGLPAGSLPTSITINAAANGKTFLGWQYDGTNIFWTAKVY